MSLLVSQHEVVVWVHVHSTTHYFEQHVLDTSKVDFIDGTCMRFTTVKVVIIVRLFVPVADDIRIATV